MGWGTHVNPWLIHVNVVATFEIILDFKRIIKLVQRISNMFYPNSLKVNISHKYSPITKIRKLTLIQCNT